MSAQRLFRRMRRNGKVPMSRIESWSPRRREKFRKFDNQTQGAWFRMMDRHKSIDL